MNKDQCEALATGLKAVKHAIIFSFVIGVSAFLYVGCNSVAPGSDPIVVRAEQVETGATNTLNGIVSIDDANRPFWITNAPAFHTFAETLRKPVQIDGLTLPAGLAAVRSLDDVKVAYIAGKATSNDVVAAISVAQSMLSQASAWSVIATNAPTH